MRRMFSKKQIERMVAENPAAVLEALKGQDIKAKTLEQTHPNWAYDVSSIEPVAPTGFTATNIFSRLQIINQELEIIFSFSVTNTTEATSSPANIQLGDITIPEEIAERIIDAKGDKVSVNSSLVAVAGTRMVSSTSTPENTTVFSAQNGILNISHSGENIILIAGYSLGAIAAGATHTYSGRIQLTLL